MCLTRYLKCTILRMHIEKHNILCGAYPACFARKQLATLLKNIFLRLWSFRSLSSLENLHWLFPGTCNLQPLVRGSKILFSRKISHRQHNLRKATNFKYRHDLLSTNGPRVSKSLLLKKFKCVEDAMKSELWYTTLESFEVSAQLSANRRLKLKVHPL